MSRRIGMIVESDSTGNFKTPQRHGNDSATGKLGDVKVERRFFLLNCGYQSKHGRDFYAGVNLRVLLKPADRYGTQLMYLNQLLKVILQDNNARLHVAEVVKIYLETLKSHRSSHIIRSITHGVVDQHLKNKIWIDS